MRVRGESGLEKLYGRWCGRELEANIFHFQYVAWRHARRDIRQDGPRLRGRVLDVGCGNKPYRPYLSGAAFYVGLEYPPPAGVASFRVKPEVYGDAHCLPFANESFDAVICTQVLEHVTRPQEVVGELARVLKPGGLGLVSVPFFYNLHLEPHDYFRFSPYGIRLLLENHGLKITELRGQGGIGSLLVVILHNWLFSGVARWARRRRLAKALVIPLVPFLVLLTPINNAAALLLDRLAGFDLRFSSNLWVLVQKAG